MSALSAAYKRRAGLLNYHPDTSHIDSNYSSLRRRARTVLLSLIDVKTNTLDADSITARLHDLDQLALHAPKEGRGNNDRRPTRIR